MTDPLSYNPVTPINKDYKQRRYSTSSFSKGKRKLDEISFSESNINSSPLSGSSKNLFSPSHLTAEFFEFNENVSPTQRNIFSNKRLKLSPLKKESISSCSSSSNISNSLKKKLNRNNSSKDNTNNNSNGGSISTNNILTPYKKNSSVRKRRRSSIGLCITSSPTTPCSKNSPGYNQLYSPTYSIRRRSITSSSKKKPFLFP
jgi:hypothetical protein